jgi:hypothetical protein
MLQLGLERGELPPRRYAFRNANAPAGVEALSDQMPDQAIAMRWIFGVSRADWGFSRMSGGTSGRDSLDVSGADRVG